MKKPFLIRDGVLIRCNLETPSVTVPEGVREIGKGAFWREVEEITLPEGVEELQSGAMLFLARLRRVSLPASLKKIGPYAFLECRSLTELALPPGLTDIPQRAFENCRSLRRVEVPEGVVSLGERAFLNCESLEDVRLPSSLERIAAQAFGGCRRLRELVVPPGVTALPKNLFSEPFGSLTATGITSGKGIPAGLCPDLERLAVPRLSIRDVPAKWKTAAMRGFAAWEAGGGQTEEPIRADYVRFLHFRRKTLGNSAVRDSVLLRFMVQESVLEEKQTSILLERIARNSQPEDVALLLQYQREKFGEPDPAREFRRRVRSLNQTGLTVPEFQANWRARRRPDGTLLLQEYLGAETSVLVPAFRGRTSVTEIGPRVFCSHPDLESVILPVGVTAIGDEAFAGCARLRRVDLPDTLTSLGAGVFRDCSALTEVELPAGLLEIGEKCFERCTSLTRIRIPSKVCDLPARAFRECHALRDVVFQEGLLRIGAFAFAYCGSLSAADLPEGLELIGQGAFLACQSMRHVALPSSLLVVWPIAFLECYALTEVELPAGLLEIGQGAFSCCQGLRRVFPAPGEGSGLPQTWNPSLFLSCPSLREVVIPARMQQIEPGTFLNCPQLERWTVDPENPALTADGPWLMSADRTRLVAVLPGLSGEIVLPEGIRVIGRGVFHSCEDITAVTIPASVESIEDAAFYGCRKLRQVTFLGTPRIVNAYAFPGAPVEKTLALPEGTVLEKGNLNHSYYSVWSLHLFIEP